MDKRLPGVFANPISTKLSNNKKVDYSKEENRREVIEQKSSVSVSKSSKNINQQLNEIFNSPRYVYKAEVTIVTNNQTLHKKIIGQNNTHLITIENEMIPISDISEIYFTN